MSTRPDTSTPEPLDDRPSNHGHKGPEMRPAYYTDPHLALYTGDAIDVLSELPDDSVHCLVTSPPYWASRDYGTATWIGGTADCTHSARSSRVTVSAANRWETPADACAAVPSAKTANTGWKATARDYVDTLTCGLRATARRVLVTTGTVWRNLGDSYKQRTTETGRHRSTHRCPARNASDEPAQRTSPRRQPNSHSPAQEPVGHAMESCVRVTSGRNYTGIETTPYYHTIAMQRLGMIAAGDDLSVREKSVNSAVVSEATRR